MCLREKFFIVLFTFTVNSVIMYTVSYKLTENRKEDKKMKFVVTQDTRKFDREQGTYFVSDTYVTDVGTYEEAFSLAIDREERRVTSVYVRPTDERQTTTFVVQTLYWDDGIERYFTESIAIRGEESYTHLQRELNYIAKGIRDKVFLIRPATRDEVEQLHNFDW